MTSDQTENKNYDVQYSIRLPQDLLDEISKRAEIEGVKPSTWIRNNLMKLIQDKDEGDAGSIKPALMYLLTSDSDVQKQIQQIASGVRKKGEVSRVENALMEYTALNEQGEVLENNINRLVVDIEDLVGKERLLHRELENLKRKLDVLKTTFDREDDHGKLHFVLAEYEGKISQKQQEIEKFNSLLDKKRSQMLNYKVLLVDVGVRKKEILSQYNLELGESRKNVESAVGLANDRSNRRYGRLHSEIGSRGDFSHK